MSGHSEAGRLCARCGRAFAPRHGNSRYCSFACAWAAHGEAARRWRDGHPGKPPRTLTCPQCGRTFETAQGMRRYCSAECYYAHERERRAAADGGASPGAEGGAS